MSAVPREVVHCPEQGYLGLGQPQIEAEPAAPLDEVLTPLALQLLRSLHRRFNARRLQLLGSSGVGHRTDEATAGDPWESLLREQLRVRDAMRSAGGLAGDDTVKLCPRGWDLPERHVRFAGEAVSGALFDFAVFAANNYEGLATARGPWLQLPHPTGEAEEQLWADVFTAAEKALGLPPASIQASRARAT